MVQLHSEEPLRTILAAGQRVLSLYHVAAGHTGDHYHCWAASDCGASGVCD